MRAHPIRLLLTASFAACLLAPMGIAQARNANVFLRAGSVADAPVGFLDMCERSATSCAEEPANGGSQVDSDAIAPPTTAQARRAEWRLIATLNRAANRRIAQVDDQQLHGVADQWVRATNAGDCEDIALEKQAELIAAGIDPRRLRLAVAYERWAGLHAVLIVTTARGDMVLDNRTSHLVRWDRTGYRWLRVQSAANERTWNMVA